MRVSAPKACVRTRRQRAASSRRPPPRPAKAGDAVVARGGAARRRARIRSTRSAARSEPRQTGAALAEEGADAALGVRRRSPAARSAAGRTRAPAASRRRAASPGASGAQTSQSGAWPTPCSRREPSGRRRPRSKTTRTGGRRGWTAPRTVRRGSSARAVPMPTATASCPARRRCTSARAASPVIQAERPAGSAMRGVEGEGELQRHPGAVRARGRWAWKKGAFRSRAACLPPPRLHRHARRPQHARRRRAPAGRGRAAA